MTPSLPDGIDPLQDRKHGPMPLGIEPLLQFGEALHAGLEQLLGLLLVDVESAGVAGVAVGKLETAALVDAKTRDDFGWEHRPGPLK